MSSNRPSNTTPKNNTPGSAQRPPAGPRRPVPPGSRVQVRPTRPQASPPPSAASRYTPFLIGGALILVAVILIGSILLSNSGSGSSATATSTAGSAAAYAATPAGSTGSAGTPGSSASGPAAGGPSTAVIETSKGTFKIHLFIDDPSVRGTVKNFQDKITSGTFNGRVFHRVEGFVIQGGDPTGTGTGGGNMPGEYNQRPFKRGAVGMASTAGHAPQVNDSQWFVVKTDTDSLDGLYDNFGQVTDGMDVVDKIAVGDKMTKLSLQP